MADPVGFVSCERDFEQGLITLKKGTQLLKYNRKGRPKFRSFRLSPDETALIWISHREEKQLKLSSVVKIVPGQRTPVFKRHLRPEKEYLSFSLLYNNGDRSLDLICKDKVETEVWFTALKTLIRRHYNRRTRSDLHDIQNFDILQSGRPYSTPLEFCNSARGRTSVDARDSSFGLGSSDVASEHAIMQLRTSNVGDGFRISVSSTPSCSSGGSGPDDIESLGDVYIWGEVWSDAIAADGSVTAAVAKVDVLSPRPLESNVVLDVQQIAGGVRHVGLVTRQGEVFTWGEESGGRLGHGTETDFCRPHLVEFLAVTNVEFVACGEHHTCAVSSSGDLFTWGDGTHNAGLLGHGTDVSHWLPKRVSGLLEGLQVISVSCGTWHTALTTSNGRLFTFGDGSFGVLGHGNQESVSYPKEVQLLSGLKTTKVACGVWHTAAIVEVMNQAGSNVLSRKLFTWGDGDKYRLGHGSKDTYLLPTCVSSLIDYNFHQLACGHTMTVALTTSGHVFTMGSSEFGQLGNTTADGKLPCLVQDKLVGEFVEEISCGSFHVAVLTSRSEVFTWGSGANGRLGHGDLEDRRTPTLIEALKDRHVKNISCGSNFTTSICIHKWVSGADQSVCSGCRQAFGFTRKRHNCYHCGLVHCHACSSKKALKAALAPTPGKPHRVCDACYAKLKAAEGSNASNSSNTNRNSTAPRRSVDGRERIDRGELKPSKGLLPGGSQADATMNRASQIPATAQMKDVPYPTSVGGFNYGWWPGMPPPQPMPQQMPPIMSPQLPLMIPQQMPMPMSMPMPMPMPQATPQLAANARPIPQLAVNSRPASPFNRKPSPPPPGYSRSVVERLKKSNESLTQDVAKLQNQVKSLKQKCNAQDEDISKLKNDTQAAVSFASGESSKFRVATEVVKSITEQLKELKEKLPPDVQEGETFKAICTQAEAFIEENAAQESSSSLPFSSETYQTSSSDNSVSRESPNLQDENADNLADAPSELPEENDRQGEPASHRSSPMCSKVPRIPGDRESIEQIEHGVYITLILRQNGAKLFKGVRFSKRRFKQQEATHWWSKNKDKVLKRYNSQSVGETSSSGSAPPEEEYDDAASQP